MVRIRYQSNYYIDDRLYQIRYLTSHLHVFRILLVDGHLIRTLIFHFSFFSFSFSFSFFFFFGIGTSAFFVLLNCFNFISQQSAQCLSGFSAPRIMHIVAFLKDFKMNLNAQVFCHVKQQVRFECSIWEIFFTVNVLLLKHNVHNFTYNIYNFLSMFTLIIIIMVNFANIS